MGRTWDLNKKFATTQSWAGRLENRGGSGETRVASELAGEKRRRAAAVQDAGARRHTPGAGGALGIAVVSHTAPEYSMRNGLAVGKKKPTTCPKSTGTPFRSSFESPVSKYRWKSVLTE